MIKKTLAAVLTLSLVILSPGLNCYAALAALEGGVSETPTMETPLTGAEVFATPGATALPDSDPIDSSDPERFLINSEKSALQNQQPGATAHVVNQFNPSAKIAGVNNVAVQGLPTAAAPVIEGDMPQSTHLLMRSVGKQASTLIKKTINQWMKSSALTEEELKQNYDGLNAAKTQKDIPSPFAEDLARSAANKMPPGLSFDRPELTQRQEKVGLPGGVYGSVNNFVKLDPLSWNAIQALRVIREYNGRNVGGYLLLNQTGLNSQQLWLALTELLRYNPSLISAPNGIINRDVENTYVYISPSAKLIIDRFILPGADEAELAAARTAQIPQPSAAASTNANPGKINGFSRGTTKTGFTLGLAAVGLAAAIYFLPAIFTGASIMVGGVVGGAAAGIALGVKYGHVRGGLIGGLSGNVKLLRLTSAAGVIMGTALAAAFFWQTAGTWLLAGLAVGAVTGAGLAKNQGNNSTPSGLTFLQGELSYIGSLIGGCAALILGLYSPIAHPSHWVAGAAVMGFLSLWRLAKISDAQAPAQVAAQGQAPTNAPTAPKHIKKIIAATIIAALPIAAIGLLALGHPLIALGLSLATSPLALIDRGIRGYYKDYLPMPLAFLKTATTEPGVSAWKRLAIIATLAAALAGGVLAGAHVSLASSLAVAAAGLFMAPAMALIHGKYVWSGSEGDFTAIFMLMGGTLAAWAGAAMLGGWAAATLLFVSAAPIALTATAVKTATVGKLAVPFAIGEIDGGEPSYSKSQSKPSIETPNHPSNQPSILRQYFRIAGGAVASMIIEGIGLTLVTYRWMPEYLSAFAREIRFGKGIDARNWSAAARLAFFFPALPILMPLVVTLTPVVALIIGLGQGGYNGFNYGIRSAIKSSWDNIWTWNRDGREGEKAALQALHDAKEPISNRTITAMILGATAIATAFVGFSITSSLIPVLIIAGAAGIELCASGLSMVPWYLGGATPTNNAQVPQQPQTSVSPHPTSTPGARLHAIAPLVVLGAALLAGTALLLGAAPVLAAAGPIVGPLAHAASPWLAARWSLGGALAGAVGGFALGRYETGPFGSNGDFDFSPLVWMFYAVVGAALGGVSGAIIGSWLLAHHSAALATQAMTATTAPAGGAGLALAIRPSWGDSVEDLDGNESWYDNSGRQWTEQTKVREALQLVLSNPLAAAIKNALPYNTLYKVERGNYGVSYAVRTTGDSHPSDPAENMGNDPFIIFTAEALRQLSPEYLAAKIASMWIRHLEKNSVPESAEKTYMEGSVLVRVFMQLTGSTAQNWRGNLDYQKYDSNDTENGADGQGFDIYRHFFSWVQGHEAQYQDVRQGPYFKNKIMGAQGSPEIYTDDAGRKTLFQRSQNGEITSDVATQGQQKFAGFAQNEQ